MTASVLNAQCSGTTSQASVVQANVVGVNITAVSSACTDGATSSSLATVNGQTIATQNFHLSVGTATLIVNETTSNSIGELARNAVHVRGLGEGVIIAQARCKAPQPAVSESHVALLLPSVGRRALRRGPPARAPSWRRPTGELTLKLGGFFGNRLSLV